MDSSESLTLDRAIGHIEELERQNSELIMNIRRLQRDYNVITDTEIEDEYVKLQVSVDNWIRTLVREVRDQTGMSLSQVFRESIQSFHPTTIEMLFNVLASATSPDELYKMRANWQAHQAGWVAWFAKYTSSVHMILSLEIWKFLHEKIFLVKLPVGTRKHFGRLVTEMALADDVSSSDGSKCLEIGCVDREGRKCAVCFRFLFFPFPLAM